MALATQSNALPTNKLAIAALIGPASSEIWQNVMLDLYPPLAGDMTTMLMAGLITLFVGYYVPDRANVPS